MEIWLPVVGYEGWYEVSDHAQVRSLDRTLVTSSGITRHYRSRLLSHNKAGAGDHHVVILSKEGVYERRLVHHLMLEAFVCPRPPGLFGLHRDDDPHHNLLPNLYWGTKSQNQDDKVRNGNHHHAKKDRCPQNHPYDEANTAWEERPNGRRARHCRACMNGRRRVIRGSASGG